MEYTCCITTATFVRSQSGFCMETLAEIQPAFMLIFNGEPKEGDWIREKDKFWKIVGKCWLENGESVLLVASFVKEVQNGT